MKNDLKFIKIVIKLFFVCVVFVTTLLFVRFQVKSLSKEKLDLKSKSLAMKNRVKEYEVEIQKLSSANLIIKRAQQELGLVRKEMNFEKLKIDNSLLEVLKYKVKEKYE